MIYNISLTKRAIKDAKRLKEIGLKDKSKKILDIIRNNPFQNPPQYEKLQGYDNRYSRRINKQHRLVYEIDLDKIKILRMWSHYE